MAEVDEVEAPEACQPPESLEDAWEKSECTEGLSDGVGSKDGAENSSQFLHIRQAWFLLQ